MDRRDAEDLPARQQGNTTTRCPTGTAEDAPTEPTAVGRGTPDQHRDRHLEAILADHKLAPGLTWVDLEAIDWDATAASQIRTETVDLDTVDRYAAAIEAGAVFPAGLASATNTGAVWIVAGVHRARAYAEAGWERFPTYWSPHADAHTLWLVSVASNVGHGLPLSYDEQVEQALRMLDVGLTQAEASTRTGLPLGRIRAAVSARRSGALLASRGMTRQWEKLPRSGQWRLGMAASGDAEVLAEAVSTATSLALTNTGLVELAAAITSARRDAGTSRSGAREAALLAIEDFEEVRRPAGGGRRAAYPWGRSNEPDPPASRPRTESQIHALRSLCREVLDVDAGQAIDDCPAGDALITVDLLTRTVARLITVTDRLKTKAGQR